MFPSEEVCKICCGGKQKFLKGGEWVNCRSPGQAETWALWAPCVGVLGEQGIWAGPWDSEGGLLTSEDSPLPGVVFSSWPVRPASHGLVTELGPGSPRSQLPQEALMATYLPPSSLPGTLRRPCTSSQLHPPQFSCICPLWKKKALHSNFPCNYCSKL